MPKTLASLITHGPYQHMFGGEWIVCAPELCVLVSKVISIWAYLDSVVLTRLLSLISGTSSSTAIAVYESMKSDGTKFAVLDAVARVNLNDREYKLFQNLFTIIKMQANSRHKLVHWIWGYSQDLPHCLLLISPKNYAAGKTDEIQGVAFSGPIPEHLQKYFSKIEVYQKTDLEKIISEFIETSKYAERFCLLWNPDFQGNKRVEIFQSLCNEPEIQSQ